ncbi:MAG: oligosaccharide flippase family protein [Acetobacteraceae bacterium]
MPAAPAPPLQPPDPSPGETRTLLSRTAGGAGWTIGWRAVTRALGFVSTLVLARILVPADFGLVALAISFSRAIDVLADLGVEDALVRATNAERAAYDTAFTINAIRGCVTATVIALSAVPFAAFFEDPRLAYVVLALALAVLLDALENVGVADFRRDFAFRREFQLAIFPRLAQVAVAVTIALIWASHWALVAGILTAALLRTTATYLMHPFRPRLSLAAWHDLIGFSVWTWLVSMARMVRERGVVMLIGGMLNPAQLGIFTLGSEIATLPESELIGPLGRVCFASFAAVRRAGTSVSDTYLRITAATFVVALPAAIGISAVAAPLVMLAFGAKWLEAIPIVEILAAAGILAVTGRISAALFNAFAILRPLFWNVIVISALQFGLLVPLVWTWGLPGAAIATAAVMLLEQAVLTILAFHRFAMRPADLLRGIWRCLAATGVMAGFLALAGLGWTAAPPGFGASLRHLAVTGVLGAGAYTAVLGCLWLACGRPAGPEADGLALAGRVASGLWHRLAGRTILPRAGPPER